MRFINVMQLSTSLRHCVFFAVESYEIERIHYSELPLAVGLLSEKVKKESCIKSSFK